MKKTSRINSSTTSLISKSTKVKPYAATEKKEDSISIVKTIEETMNETSGGKNEGEYKYEPSNFISTKTSVVIDEQNKINTEKFLEIFKMGSTAFKYAERHSIGKKFVSQKLV